MGGDVVEFICGKYERRAYVLSGLSQADARVYASIRMRAQWDDEAEIGLAPDTNVAAVHRLEAAN